MLAATGNHFSRQHHFPCDTHANRRTGENRWQRSGQDNLSEKIPLRCAHGLGCPQILNINSARTAEHIDHDREESAEECHKCNRELCCRPEYDRRGHPCQRRDWPKNLEWREKDVSEVLVYGKRQSKWDADNLSNQKAEKHPEKTEIPALPITGTLHDVCPARKHVAWRRNLANPRDLEAKPWLGLRANLPEQDKQD